MSTLLKDRLFIALQYCLPQHALSRGAGWLASCETRWFKNFLIKRFIASFNVAMDEAAETAPERYKHFNDFFTRTLKPDARSIDTSADGLCSPADGAISQLGTIQKQLLLQAKGHYYSLDTLLANNQELAEQFSDGEFATIYLSPKDYHRVHMPCDGKLVNATYVPGRLFSVNQTTADNVANLFALNERLICEFETEHGKMVMILVGAMIVAAIETIWRDYSDSMPQTIEASKHNQDFGKGEEMGRFKLGSTVILLFEKDRIRWNDSLSSESTLKMGEHIAKKKD